MRVPRLLRIKYLEIITVNNSYSKNIDFHSKFTKLDNSYKISPVVFYYPKLNSKLFLFFSHVYQIMFFKELANTFIFLII